jgi:hypothetical protein
MAKPSLDSLSPGQQPLGRNTSVLSIAKQNNCMQMKFMGIMAGYERWYHGRNENISTQVNAKPVESRQRNKQLRVPERNFD